MTVLRRRALLGLAPMLLAAAPARAGAARVVALDFGLAQTLLALGVVPAGLPSPAQYREWVVEPPLPAGVADIGGRSQPNMEALAELAPDLILTVAEHDAILPRLQAIAPVLRLPIYTELQDPWRLSEAAARAIGAAIGRREAAERLIAATDSRYAEARTALAGRSVRPLLLASFLDPRHIRLYGAGSILQAALDRLGLRNAWSGRTGIWGSATVGLDTLAPLTDAALFAIDPQPPAIEAVLAASPLWQALPLVRDGRVFTLPPVLMFGTLPAADRFASLLLPRLTGAALRA